MSGGDSKRVSNDSRAILKSAFPSQHDSLSTGAVCFLPAASYSSLQRFVCRQDLSKMLLQTMQHSIISPQTHYSRYIHNKGPPQLSDTAHGIHQILSKQRQTAIFGRSQEVTVFDIFGTDCVLTELGGCDTCGRHAAVTANSPRTLLVVFPCRRWTQDSFRLEWGFKLVNFHLLNASLSN